MKYFLLILSLLLVVGMLNPKAWKLNTLKGTVNILLEQYKNDVHKSQVAVGFSQILAIVYCVILSVFVHSFGFTVVMALWIAQSVFDHNTILK